MWNNSSSRGRAGVVVGGKPLLFVVMTMDKVVINVGDGK